MRRKIRLTESDLHRIVRNAVIRALNETSNPFEGEFYPDWKLKNAIPVSDEEYHRFMMMDPVENAYEIFNEIGFHKWNGFLMRWAQEDPEDYERRWKNQMPF